MKRNDISKFFKPVSKTPKIDSNEQNTELEQWPDIGLEVVADIEENHENNENKENNGNNENGENQTDQIDSSPSDILDIKSKLVEEFMEKLASHGLKLNSTLDLVSCEVDPSTTTIETEIVSQACDIIEQPRNESEIGLAIVEQYHPPSDFKFPSKKIGNGKWNRSCKHDYFEKWKWLHYTGYLIAKCMLNSY